jgi:hypothetical protein
MSRSLESGQLLESGYNDRNFSNNRPQVSNPFGGPQSSSPLAPILAALSACLGSIMDAIHKFFRKKQGPTSVVVNGKTYTILQSLGEGGT